MQISLKEINLNEVVKHLSVLENVLLYNVISYRSSTSV
jgi:hypothetical protein